MYRTLREGRYDITVQSYQDAVQMLAFKKTDSFQVGLLMKSLLMRSDLNVGSPQVGHQGSIFD